MRQMNKSMKLLPLVACMSLAFNAQAERISYSQSLIKSILPPGQDIDISHFEKGLELKPGVYDLELKINDKVFARRAIELREVGGRLEPVFTRKDLMLLPIKEGKLAELADKSLDAEIFPLSNYLDHSTAKYDPTHQQLMLSIPQIFIDERDAWTDIAPEELWDNGIPGAIFNYNLSATHLDSRVSSGAKNTSLYGMFNAQVNIGGWRLYSSGSLIANRDNWGNGTISSREWNLWNTYLQRDINSVKGLLQIGEISTSGEIFDSIPMRGLRLTTNEYMIPNADRQYSPIIEGVANSNAQIFIRQNGRIVYTTNVAAGPFRLENLPVFGSEGDLDVVIKEADGTERYMVVPYSSIPMMLKEGQYRYDINVGQYFRRDMQPGTERKAFTMGTLSYGLPNAITVYGGAIVAEDYLGSALGAGISLGRLGALSVDATQSKAYNVTNVNTGLIEDLSGTAWRIRYEKTMMSTGTTIDLANLHYLTGNYRTFNEIASNNSAYFSPVLTQSMKSSWQLALSQTLGSYGSISGGMTYTTYKGDAEDSKSINFGYSTNFKGVGVNLNYGRNYEQRANSGWTSSHSVMLNLNIPLSMFFSGTGYTSVNRTDVQYQGSMYKSPTGEKTYRQRATVGGYSEDNSWNWTLSQTMGRVEERESSLRVGYDGSTFGADVGYAYSRYAHNIQAGLNGSFVLHEGGITPAKYAFGAVALIEVPEVEGVKVNNAFDSSTDSNGYAALSYLTTYSRNSIGIDPSTLPEGVLLKDTTAQNVYPTYGAIVKVKYPVRVGHSALFYLMLNGKPMPFASHVELVDENGHGDPYVKGLVGENGRVYLSALPTKGVLRIALDDDRVALFEYILPNIINRSDDISPLPKLEINGSVKYISSKVENGIGVINNAKNTVNGSVIKVDKVGEFSNGRIAFRLKDKNGHFLSNGSVVHYKNTNGSWCKAVVKNKGLVILSDIPEVGELLSGDDKYVY